ncbi:hypothetical protein [Acidiphilium sp. C61]|jgi:hypothetical protein|uniref:hypothetical protein n=1 Tax=Acidiphilium sp. C61 TaxID=1671485 RepID=UPI00157B43EA|nr:hypothetical protein [Acidiphilium sp. C61]
MEFLKRSEWLILGVLAGCLSAAIIVLAAKYAYENHIYFFSNNDYYNQKSAYYFKQIKDYRNLEPGQLIHMVNSENQKGKNFSIYFDQSNINKYKIKIRHLSKKTCRFILDMSFSSNIIKNMWINNKSVGMFQVQPIEGPFIRVNGKAVTLAQDDYAQRQCQANGSGIKIGLGIVVHSRDD